MVLLHCLCAASPVCCIACVLHGLCAASPVCCMACVLQVIGEAELLMDKKEAAFRETAISSEVVELFEIDRNDFEAILRQVPCAA
jgi:hypothetical protein